MKLIKITTLAFLVMLSAFAMAGALDDAKAKGLVGEKPDGYLGAVDNSAVIVALVDEVNEKRRKQYEQLAKRNNLEVEQVEKLAAKKAYEKTAKGNLIFVNGEWVQK